MPFPEHSGQVGVAGSPAPGKSEIACSTIPSCSAIDTGFAMLPAALNSQALAPLQLGLNSLTVRGARRQDV